MSSVNSVLFLYEDGFWLADSEEQAAEFVKAQGGRGLERDRDCTESELSCVYNVADECLEHPCSVVDEAPYIEFV